jgi:hypothetical protein
MKVQKWRSCLELLSTAGARLTDACELGHNVLLKKLSRRVRALGQFE